MVKVQGLTVEVRHYHDIVAVVRKDIVVKIPTELLPFIDWEKLPRPEYVSATIVNYGLYAKKVYLSKEPFAVVVMNKETKGLVVHYSCDFEIPDDVIPFLLDEVKQKLGLEEVEQGKEEQQEEREEEEEI